VISAGRTKHENLRGAHRIVSSRILQQSVRWLHQEVTVSADYYPRAVEARQGARASSDKIARDFILELTSGLTGRIVEMIHLSARCGRLSIDACRALAGSR